MYTKIHKVKRKDGSYRKYLQIVETKRVEDRDYPVQKLLLNVCRIDGMDDKRRKMLFNLANGILRVLGREVEDIEEVSGIRKTGEKWCWGLVDLVSALWKQLGVKDVLEEIRRDREIEYSLSKVILLIVLGRLWGKLSERKVYRWRDKVWEEFGFGEIELHHLYRGLDLLSANWDKVEARLKGKVMDLFHLKADVMFLDTTTLIYWGEGNTELTKRGYSKQKRGDKKQVVIGVALIDGMPVGVEVAPGNMGDLEVMERMLEKFKERFNLREICLVSDAGMVKLNNLKKYRKKKWKYLVGAKKTEKVVKEKVREFSTNRSLWKKINDDRVARSFRISLEKEREEDLIIVRNEKQARRDRKKRESILQRLKEKEGKDVKELVKNKGYKKYLRAGKKIEIDTNRAKEEEIWDGIWYIRTNKEFKTLKKAIHKYTELETIERTFKDLKNLIKVPPIYHWNQERIKGHIYACFLALLVMFSIRREIKEMEIPLQWDEIMDELKDLKVEWLKIKEKDFLLRDALTDWQTSLFKSHKVNIPASVLDTR